MYSLLSAIFLLIIGAICSYNAKLRGRNPLAWFGIGLCLGALGLLLLYLLPSKNSSLQASPSIATNTPPSPEIVVNLEQQHPKMSSPSSPPQKLWYYLNNENKRYGPMSFDRLKQAWREDQITRDTFVWNEDMKDWKLVKELSDILDQLGESKAP